MKYSRLREIFFDILVFSVPIYIFLSVFRHIFPIFVPLVFALFTVHCVKPLNTLLSARLPRKIAAFISVAALFLLAFAVLCFLFCFAFKGIAFSARGLPAAYASAQKSFYTFFGKINSTHGKNKLFSDFSAMLCSASEKGILFIQDGVAELLKKLSSVALSAAAGVPSALICVFTAFLSAFFILADEEYLVGYLRTHLPVNVFSVLKKAHTVFFGAVLKYINAQLIVAGIVFSLLFAGFLLLNIGNALPLGLITAFVDAVPILGTGTVILPYAAFLFICKKNALGWGLVALYGVCTLARQLLEPKIIGSKMGLHPILSIFSIYAGIKLCGICGIFLGPVCALFVKCFLISE